MPNCANGWRPASPCPTISRTTRFITPVPPRRPEGYASGSFGPTTAGRMDSYVDQFQAAGGSMVMLAKGNRSRQVRRACQAHGGFYLGSIGGPAARLAQDCIKKVEVVEYPELGMEAIWRIEVEDFPAFIVIDDKGNDFFKELNPPHASRYQPTFRMRVWSVLRGCRQYPDQLSGSMGRRVTWCYRGPLAVSCCWGSPFGWTCALSEVRFSRRQESGSHCDPEKSA
jgi:tartrate/fumarate subfamily iron-sulfur-dependent hydro-lyase beta chain